jgi:hypothetical protein
MATTVFSRMRSDIFRPIAPANSRRLDAGF